MFASAAAVGFEPTETQDLVQLVEEKTLSSEQKFQNVYDLHT